MKDQLNKYIEMKAWGLSGLVCLIAVFVWADLLNWKLGQGLKNVYILFPLFGLLAFSLMWSHYIIWALRLYSGADKQRLKSYSKITGYFVLAFILLHPFLIIWKLYDDSLGLPPASYEAYVGKSMLGAVYLGTLALWAFILYEFKSKLETKKVWKYITWANHLALFLILIHGLKLGSHLQTGWFRGLWIFYGVGYIIALSYALKTQNSQKSA